MQPASATGRRPRCQQRQPALPLRQPECVLAVKLAVRERDAGREVRGNIRHLVAEPVDGCRFDEPAQLDRHAANAERALRPACLALLRPLPSLGSIVPTINTVRSTGCPMAVHPTRCDRAELTTRDSACSQLRLREQHEGLLRPAAFTRSASAPHHSVPATAPPPRGAASALPPVPRSAGHGS